MQPGRVVGVSRAACSVIVSGEVIRCDFVSSRSFKDGGTVVVGDHVLVRKTEPGRGAIEEVLPRFNMLGRARDFDGQGRAGSTGPKRVRGVRYKADQILAANVDQALLVFSFRSPRTNFQKVDLMLIAAEVGKVTPVLCFNKADLESEEVLKELPVYRDLGVRVIETSTVTGRGIDELRQLLSRKATVLWGPSGVGKSSLVNALWPRVQLRTGVVSQGTGMGVHTTVEVQMIQCDEDTWVIDSPGWRHFVPLSAPRSVVDRVFQEVSEVSYDCRYGNCTHRKEPGCAVRKAVEAGRVSRRRAMGYIQALTGLQP